MSLRRVGWLTAIAVAAWLLVSCGQVYRPVVIPTGTTPPDPENFHTVFGISSNVSSNPGSALQIDVSGDTDIGAANMGVSPTHATILPNNSRVFVANAGSLFAGDADNVMAFTPASQSSTATGLGAPTVFSLPFGSLPVFVNTAQAGAVFVANYGTNTVSSLNTSSNVVSLTGAVGSHPVALAETPNTLNLYVANEGDGTVTDLSPADLSTLATIPVGSTPVWVVVRKDGARVYVLTQGGGQLVPIDTASNTVLPSQTNLSVGGGANLLLYDPHLNRLYVTNPSTSTVYVFSATGGVDAGGTANDTPTRLAAIPMTTGTNPPCPNGCTPVSVAALADGSRFYVASYQSVTPCPDANVGGGAACIIPMLTVFDASALTVKSIAGAPAATAPSLPLLTPPQFASGQYALPPAASCVTPAPPATYAPGTTRFRMFATAAADSSHVYVSICDAGAIADVSTTTSSISTGGTNSGDQLVTNLVSPSASCGANCSSVAAITGFSISANVVTFTAANNFFAGEKISITGLTTGTYLNGKTLTVLATGLSPGSFECNFTNADVNPPIADSGSAVPLTPPQTPIFLLTGQ
jgi:DNA-binding beta-propeller fold protein YncE